MSLDLFVSVARVEVAFQDKKPVRSVFRSEVVREADARVLEHFMADRIPTYYRDPERISDDIKRGYFTTGIADTLARLPTKDSFRESHFGEVLAAEFAASVMGLRLLYSKLRLLTAENSNAYKMDTVMYDPETDPVELVFLEVKSSLKELDPEGEPARHDKSIYPSLFSSLRGYGKGDLRYDLTAARDRLDQIPDDDRDRVAASLNRYGGPTFDSRASARSTSQLTSMTKLRFSRRANRRRSSTWTFSASPSLSR